VGNGVRVETRVAAPVVDNPEAAAAMIGKINIQAKTKYLLYIKLSNLMRSSIGVVKFLLQFVLKSSVDLLAIYRLH
jgi:hypothetical protein